ncbi:GntR family transcriptional regulator [Clostridiaceae bacterium 14S0207]|nr:GntR family transcriptional regulator [Clostridiaceae bacterium 14S0207]
MKFSQNTPIYTQIMNFIKGKVINGELNPGDKVPSVRELSSQLKINPNTIQRAYGELEREGITYTQRGMGTFIVEDDFIITKLKKHMAQNIIDEFIIQMNNLGFYDESIITLISQNLKMGN